MSTTNSKLTRVADNIRILSAAMVEKAKSGHPGGAMGGADFITVLFAEFLRYDPDNMTYPYRDRFFLDPGHMSPMLYSTLALAGHYSTEDLQSLRQWGSVTPGHPEVDVLRGVDVDDLRDAGRNLLQGDFVAAGHPDDRHHDHDDAREHRADQKSLRGDARDGRRAAQGHQRRAPVHRNREQPDVQPVLRQSRNADHVGDRRGGESQYGGIPDDVLNPLQEDHQRPGKASEIPASFCRAECGYTCKRSCTYL